MELSIIIKEYAILTGEEGKIDLSLKKEFILLSLSLPFLSPAVVRYVRCAAHMSAQ